MTIVMSPDEKAKNNLAVIATFSHTCLCSMTLLAASTSQQELELFLCSFDL